MSKRILNRVVELPATLEEESKRIRSLFPMMKFWLAPLSVNDIKDFQERLKTVRRNNHTTYNRRQQTQWTTTKPYSSSLGYRATTTYGHPLS